MRYIVAGGNAMQLRRRLEEGVQVILSELSRMAVSLEGKQRLAQMAESICYDPDLTRIARSGDGYGFDVRSGQIAHMAEAGTWDWAAGLKARPSAVP